MRPQVFFALYGVNRFQFTHPGKGATVGLSHTQRYKKVSIHAPWEGCDQILVAILCRGVKFQFTHPGKGATAEGTQNIIRLQAFQFTHPGKGATVVHEMMMRGYNVFQFTHPGKGATG